MLQISKQVDYAVQLLVELKKLEKDEYLSLKKFSKDKKISFLFLQRIARILKKTEIIKSKRGVLGGYFLNKEVKNLSLKKLIIIVDGFFGVSDCTKINFTLDNFHKKNEKCVCPREGCCESRKIFIKLNEELALILEKIIII